MILGENNIELKIPQHVAIIMDGNGRWAKQRHMPRTYGHAQGARVLEQTLEDCDDLGVKYLTVYAFSTENWSRPLQEIQVIMKLFRDYLTYGGMPMTLFQKTDADKKQYLSGLFRETYLRDIEERHQIMYPEALDQIATELSSAIGSLTNSSKLADTLRSVKGTGIDSETVGSYL